MIYMEKIFSESQEGGSVPADLSIRFNDIIDSLGVVKKRALAAAIHAFCAMERDAQYKLIAEVTETYYPQPTGRGEGPDAAKIGAAARQLPGHKDHSEPPAQGEQKSARGARRSAG